MNIQKNVIEKMVKRELREDEWSRLEKAEWNDVYNWIQCHMSDERNS